jgi:hypothetical protein
MRRYPGFPDEHTRLELPTGSEHSESYESSPYYSETIANLKIEYYTTAERLHICEKELLESKLQYAELTSRHNIKVVELIRENNILLQANNVLRRANAGIRHELHLLQNLERLTKSRSSACCRITKTAYSLISYL